MPCPIELDASHKVADPGEAVLVPAIDVDLKDAELGEAEIGPRDLGNVQPELDCGSQTFDGTSVTSL